MCIGIWVSNEAVSSIGLLTVQAQPPQGFFIFVMVEETYMQLRRDCTQEFVEDLAYDAVTLDAGYVS